MAVRKREDEVFPNAAGIDIEVDMIDGRLFAVVLAQSGCGQYAAH